MEKVHNILEIVLGLILLIAVALIVFIVLTELRPASQSSVREVNFEQYHAAAAQFKRRMFDYAGVCQDLLLPADIDCDDGDDGYRIYANTDNFALECADSTGFRGTVASLQSGTLTCR